MSRGSETSERRKPIGLQACIIGDGVRRRQSSKPCSWSRSARDAYTLSQAPPDMTREYFGFMHKRAAEGVTLLARL